MRSIGAIVVLAVGVGVCAPASAAVVTDPSYFTTIPHTYLDFEALPDGTVLADLTEQTAAFISRDAFVSQGVRFGSNPFWIRSNDVSAYESAYKQALQHGESPLHSITGGSVAFDAPVRSVGLLIAFDSSSPDMDASAWLRFFDADNGLIDLVILDDRFGLDTIAFEYSFGQSRFVHFGFVGAAFETPIARFDINFATGVIPRIDDLYFSAVPAPGAGAVFALAGALALRRRR